MKYETNRDLGLCLIAENDSERTLLAGLRKDLRRVAGTELYLLSYAGASSYEGNSGFDTLRFRIVDRPLAQKEE